MLWGELFVLLTLLSLFTYTDKSCLIAVVGLIMWTALEKVIYQFGVVEANGTLLITLIFTIYMVIAWYFFGGWLFIGLFVIAILTMLWTTSDVTDPYTFKAGKNILYGSGLVLLWLSYFWSSQGAES